MTDTKRGPFAARQLVAALLLATIAVSNAGIARAVELIPSFGMTKSTDANAVNASGSGGLALRASLLPFLKLEGGIGYRQDSFTGPDLKVRQWPVAASLWVSPLPMVYAGGGVGWYKTTLDYRDNLIVKDSTSQRVGVHVGGGVDLPLGPKLALDLNGRYIFMQKNKATLTVPTSFNPDFWNLGLGLAIRF